MRFLLAYALLYDLLPVESRKKNWKVGEKKMKKLGFILAAAAITLLISAVTSVAQTRPGMMWRGSGGWGPGTPYNRMYDPKAVKTITGEVTRMDRITPAKGMSGGIHMLVKNRQRNDLRAPRPQLVS
jgi:hypothetical protein